GAVLLALGGSAAIALRPTRARACAGRLAVLSADEYSILAAIAERVVGVPAGAPSTAQVDVALRADRAMRLWLPSVQKELQQLLHLFENGLTGVTTGTGFAPFTASSRSAQDARLAAWSTSRVSLLRTGFQAIKRLTAACYYSAPESWASLGFPGPPTIDFDSAARVPGAPS
ncbi:MAG: gluconate 2-dehydrogenase subunit 3 family protein, partial [Thermoanaerobaculia bacterium]